jgi:hypothetical protein
MKQVIFLILVAMLSISAFAGSIEDLDYSDCSDTETVCTEWECTKWHPQQPTRCIKYECTAMEERCVGQEITIDDSDVIIDADTLNGRTAEDIVDEANEYTDDAVDEERTARENADDDLQDQIDLNNLRDDEQDQTDIEIVELIDIETQNRYDGDQNIYNYISEHESSWKSGKGFSLESLGKAMVGDRLFFYRDYNTYLQFELDNFATLDLAEKIQERQDTLFAMIMLDKQKIDYEVKKLSAVIKAERLGTMIDFDGGKCTKSGCYWIIDRTPKAPEKPKLSIEELNKIYADKYAQEIEQAKEIRIAKCMNGSRLWRNYC